MPSDEQADRVAPPQHRGEQVERRVVGPVQVLEHERERRRRADGVERLEHLAQHPGARRALRAVAHRLGVRAVVEQPRQLDEPRRRALRERGHDRLPRRAAGEVAERLQDRHVRLAGAAVAEALPDARGHAGAGQERVDERALADARLAAHHHAGAQAAHGALERPVQQRELPCAPDRARGARRAPAGAGTAGGGGAGAASAGSCSRMRPLERARPLAGREAELDEVGREVAVGGERLDLPPDAVEGEHQRADELLAERVDRHEAAQLRHRLLRAAQRDERAGAALLGLAAQVLQPPDLRLGEVRAGEVRERAPAPQRERAVVGVQRRGGGEPGGRADAALEAVGVDLLGGDRQPVADAVADEQLRRRAAVAAGLEERAQVRDADRQRARGDLARDALPGRLEQRLGRHRAPGVEQEPREDRALLGAGRGGARGGPGDLDRAEDAEVHVGRDFTAARGAVNAP